MSDKDTAKFHCKMGWLFAALIVPFFAIAAPAYGHSFNVALVVPMLDSAAAPGAQFKDGFMLATTQRDAHEGNEADGHLGGLDVYVTVLSGADAMPGKISGQVQQGEIDIVIPFVSDTALAAIGKQLDGSRALLLMPGRSPFLNPDQQAAVKNFTAAYRKLYDRAPTSQAAQGYNAARRIDLAVRALDAVDDKAALRASFEKSKQGFEW